MNSEAGKSVIICPLHAQGGIPRRARQVLLKLAQLVQEPLQPLLRVVAMSIARSNAKLLARALRTAAVPWAAPSPFVVVPEDFALPDDEDAAE